MIDEHGTVHVSNSLLSNTLCSTRVLLSHHHRLTTPQENIAAEAGRAAHEALASYFRDGDVAAALVVFRHAYREYAEQHVSADDRLNYADTHDILAHWMAQHPRSSFPFEIVPEWIEIAFQIPLSDECVCGAPKAAHDPSAGGEPHEWRPAFVFSGRLDAVVRHRTTGALFVLDHKTSNRLYLDKYRLDSQMSGYVWAAQQTLNKRVAGFYINGISFAALPQRSTNKCRKHKIPYEECRLDHADFKLQQFTRSAPLLDEWRKTALSLGRRFRDLSENFPRIEDIARARTQGSFYGSCGWCFAADFCAAGRPTQWVRSLFAERPPRDLT